MNADQRRIIKYLQITKRAATAAHDLLAIENGVGNTFDFSTAPQLSSLFNETIKTVENIGKIVYKVPR